MSILERKQVISACAASQLFLIPTAASLHSFIPRIYEALYWSGMSSSTCLRDDSNRNLPFLICLRTDERQKERSREVSKAVKVKISGERV